MEHTSFLNEDGIKIETTVFYDDNSIPESCLKRIFQNMCESGDMIIGFGTKWSHMEPRVVLLKLCTQVGCVLVRLSRYNSGPSYLKHFLSNEDIVFAGVHIKKDIKKLQKDYGIDIKNVVDLSELAASVLHQPRLLAYSVRGLASEVLLQPWKPRSWNMVKAAWYAVPLIDHEMIQCATVDVYVAYKIAKKLIG
ncbi:Werner Syndrome-like exonuclease [Pistacia vera]|uniref:Werner Syndrome-like exonuclease n=1 Tax=Pistacia vera TaxID=55513 RepID=UPI001262DEBE|nr:Werner Syndrome-like exonuclease [Pistacia vera]